MTIMVVDDSRIQRNIIKNCLNQKYGDETKVIEAPDGERAEQILQRLRPDLLLLDWNMPMLNGLELVKKVRCRTDISDLPIIMITSESAKYNVIEAIKSGVSDYLIKPVKPENLLSKIERLGLEE